LGEVNDLEQTTADPEIIETTDPNTFYERFPKVKTIMDDINFDQSNETENEFMSGRASCGLYIISYSMLIISLKIRN
jgi:hypothetical protein